LVDWDLRGFYCEYAGQSLLLGKGLEIGWRVDQLKLLVSNRAWQSEIFRPQSALLAENPDCKVRAANFHAERVFQSAQWQPVFRVMECNQGP
jgi:hypothetical protein